jgi:CrcB protein
MLERKAILAVISIGGALGSVARWGLGVWWPHSPGALPWATYTINVVGSFLLAVLVVLVTEVWSTSTYLRPFLGVGVLGGFTTFSTYMLDVHELLLDGRVRSAAVYLVASPLSGLVSAWIGLAVTRPLAERLIAPVASTSAGAPR